MKYLFCLDSQADLRKMEEGQIDALATGEGIEIFKLVVDEENQQETILNYLENFNDDEYIVFVPTKNLLVSQVRHKSVEKLIGKCVDIDADYCRIRRISSNQRLRENSTEHVDSSDIFYLCPHIFKVSALKDSVGRVASGKMFWYSLETKDLKGIYHFSSKENSETAQEFSYFVPHIFHTLTEIVTIDGRWSSAYLDFNKKILRDKIAEYNLNVEERGSDNYKTINGCCGQ